MHPVIIDIATQLLGAAVIALVTALVSRVADRRGPRTGATPA